METKTWDPTASPNNQNKQSNGSNTKAKKTKKFKESHGGLKSMNKNIKYPKTWKNAHFTKFNERILALNSKGSLKIF